VGDGRLRFWLAPFDAAGDRYYIDNVVLEKLDGTAPPPPPPPSNVLVNPGFESGTSPWNFYTNGGGSFTTVSPGSGSTRAAMIAITAPGTNVQLNQKNVPLVAGSRYRLSFDAYSNSGHDVEVILHKDASPYTNYGLKKTFYLTGSWSTYSVEFDATGFSGSVGDGRLRFWLAPFDAAGDRYYIDNVVLEATTSTKVRIMVGESVFDDPNTLSSIGPDLGIGIVTQTTAEYQYTILEKLADSVAEHKVYGYITRPTWHPDPVGIAKWYANAALDHPEIIGVMLDDVIDQLAKGDWTNEIVLKMIRAIRTNPQLKIMLTCYPRWGELDKSFNWDFDAVWLAVNGDQVLGNLDYYLNLAYQKFPEKEIWVGVYPNGGWNLPPLTPEQLRAVIITCREHYQRGKIAGIAIYDCGYMAEHPEMLAILTDDLNSFMI
jgi:hypothetical protein